MIILLISHFDILRKSDGYFLTLLGRPFGAFLFVAKICIFPHNSIPNLPNHDLFCFFAMSSNENRMDMNRTVKAIAALMLMMVFAVGCAKPDEPNDGGQNNSIVDHSGTLNGHNYVDLGLPSGTLWANCNVGAETPEGYGDYFAWGETEPKTTYDWSTYKYRRRGNGELGGRLAYARWYGSLGSTERMRS